MRARHNCQDKARRHERGGENRGYPGQQVGRTADAHKPAAASAAYSEPAAFAALQQNDPDQGDRQNQVNYEDDCFQRLCLPTANPDRCAPLLRNTVRRPQYLVAKFRNG